MNELFIQKGRWVTNYTSSVFEDDTAFPLLLATSAIRAGKFGASNFFSDGKESSIKLLFLFDRDLKLTVREASSEAHRIELLVDFFADVGSELFPFS